MHPTFTIIKVSLQDVITTLDQTILYWLRLPPEQPSSGGSTGESAADNTNGDIATRYLSNSFCQLDPEPLLVVNRNSGGKAPGNEGVWKTLRIFSFRG
jgi:hypothetical protein